MVVGLGWASAVVHFAGVAGGAIHKPSAFWENIKGTPDQLAPLGRIPAAATACDDRLYVFGGETDDNTSIVPNRYLGDLWSYTPGDGWAQVSSGGGGSGPAPRVLSSMVCSRGALTIFGGLMRRSELDNVIVGDVWSFDLAAGSWKCLQQDSSEETGPGPTSSHTATIVDSDPDSMIIFGGTDSQGYASNKTWIYSLSKRTWTDASPSGSAPSARSFHTAVAIPGTSAFSMWGGIVDPSVWSYDLETGAWSVVASNLTYLSGRSGAELGGVLLSFGGLKIIGVQTLYNAELLFQELDGSWSEVQLSTAQVPEGRCYATFARIGEDVYMFGGYRRSLTVGEQERLPDLWRLSIARNDSQALMV